MSDTLSALREELVKVEGREAQVKGEMEELNEQVEKFREDMAELRCRAEGVEEEIQELKKRGSDDTSSLGNVKRQMTAKVEKEEEGSVANAGDVRGVMDWCCWDLLHVRVSLVFDCGAVLATWLSLVEWLLQSEWAVRGIYVCREGDFRVRWAKLL